MHIIVRLAKASCVQRAEMRQKQSVDGPERSISNWNGDVSIISEEADQKRVGAEDQSHSALAIKGKKETGREEKGKTHGERKAKRVQRREDALKSDVDQETESAQATAEEVQKAEEDRPEIVPQVLLGGQGKSVQKQEGADRNHPKGKGREAARAEDQRGTGTQEEEELGEETAQVGQKD